MTDFNVKKVSLLLIPVLLFILLITLFASSNRTNFSFKASDSDYPQNLKITNITDDSLTINFSTSGKVSSSVLFGKSKDKLDYFSLDDRDQLDQSSKEYKSHFITLRGLEPNTKYFFSINSGKNIYINNGELFEISTGPRINGNPPPQLPAVGSVRLENNTTPNEGVIFLKTDESQEISALIKNGRYIIPLNNLRKQNLISYFLLENNTNIYLEAVANEEGGQKTVNKLSISPVENFVLKNNFNLNTIYKPTIQTEKNSTSPIPTDIKTNNKSTLETFNIFRFFQSGL